jgi:copper chaperone CopZ
MRIHLHRLSRAPKATVERVTGDVTHLRIDGMACDAICATRTQRALAALDGVEDVHVDFEHGTAVVRGAPRQAEEYDRALGRVVTAMPLRRAIERTVRRLRRAR